MRSVNNQDLQTQPRRRVSHQPKAVTVRSPALANQCRFEYSRSAFERSRKDRQKNLGWVR